MKKATRWITTVIVTFILLDWIFGQIFNLYVDRFGLKGDYESIDYLLNRCDDNIVVLGSSVGLNDINTKQLQDSLGITSFNGGANAQTFPYFLTTLKALTSHQQKPEFVILCMSPNNLTYSGIGERYKILAPYYNRDISDIDSCLRTHTPYEQLFLSSNSYRLNTIWFRIFLYNFITAGLTGENGFVAKPVPPAFPTKTDPENLSAPIVPERQNEINRFIDICQSNDIQLMIILTPQYINSDPAVAGQLLDICNRKGIAFYNDILHPRFNSDSTMFYDNLHLNINGAEIYTLIIMERIKEIFLKNSDNHEAQ